MNHQHLSRHLGVSLTVCILLAGPVIGSANPISIETVPIGNPGNGGYPGLANLWGLTWGAVNYDYNIGKYEVTSGQYTAFLNAVAGVDTYGLYNLYMSDTAQGSGITQNGAGSASNRYTYSVAADSANRPVNFVSFWDACRFANWLNNGQPTGAEGPGTTETGTYTLTAAGIANNTVVRNTGCQWAVASEDEWYKAAYYNPATGTYYLYPTSSNTAPGYQLTDPPPGNNANFGYGDAYWPIDGTHFTTVVGQFKNSPSPYGTFDQGGNVAEWTDTLLYGAWRIDLGGSWEGSNAMTANEPSIYGAYNEDQLHGFRVSELGAFTVSFGTTTDCSSISVDTTTTVNGTLNFTHSDNQTLAGTLSIGPGGVFNKSGSGTFTISATQSHSLGAQLNLSGGATIMTTDAGSSVPAPGSRTLAIATSGTGTTLTFTVSEHLASLTVGAGTLVTANPGGVIVTDSLSIAGTLDLTTSALIFKNAGTAGESTVAALILAAYDNGAWDHPGVTSTTIKNSSKRAREGIGYALASEVLGASGGTWMGETVGPDDLLVLPTFRGDALLAGTVTSADFDVLALNFGKSADWAHGDWIGAGVVTSADFDLLAQNFGKSISGGGLGDAAPVSLPDGSDVPEPASLSLLALGGLLLSRGRLALSLSKGRR